MLKRIDRRVVLAAGALLAFLLLVLARRAGLAEGWWQAGDRMLLLSLRETGDRGKPIGPDGLVGVAIAITDLGSRATLTPVVALVAAALLIVRAWRHALLLATDALLGGRAVDMLKLLVARARPDIVPHFVHIDSASFPSAHAANATIVYVGIATIAARVVATRPVRRRLIAAAAVLALTIGVTRVYLGVHWPSDVLAGWLFGFGWAMAWWYAAARLGGREVRR